MSFKMVQMNPGVLQPSGSHSGPILYNESVLLTAKSSPLHKSGQNEITP